MQSAMFNITGKGGTDFILSQDTFPSQTEDEKMSAAVGGKIRIRKVS